MSHRKSTTLFIASRAAAWSHFYNSKIYYIAVQWIFSFRNFLSRVLKDFLMILFLKKFTYKFILKISIFPFFRFPKSVLKNWKMSWECAWNNFRTKINSKKILHVYLSAFTSSSGGEIMKFFFKCWNKQKLMKTQNDEKQKSTIKSRKNSSTL